ncbi:autophagy-related protein 5, partial [Dichotomocladium elegans]
VWYEYQGQPLKWHYPIGLLYDLQGGAELPWRITIRFSGFPTDKLLRNPSVESAQDMFMAMVKQADFLRHGTTKRVMNLSKSDQTQLWRSLWSDRYEDYWSVNQNLMNDSELRFVPMRIYLPDDCPVIQEPVSYADQGKQVKNKDGH